MGKMVTVNGERYLLGGVAGEDVEDGALVRDGRNRRVWRVLCRDDGDVVMRNLRFPGMVDAERPSQMACYRCLEPLR